MPVEQVGQSAVVSASTINPSIFSQLWLVKHKIVSNDDFKDGCVFAPQYAQVNTSTFQLLAVSDRIQITPFDATAGQLVRDVLGGIVTLLPHTPYSAAAMNFQWQCNFPGKNFDQVCRKILCATNVISPDFADENASFGAYYSKDMFGSRMKLDIRPAVTDELKIIFSFVLEKIQGDAPTHINQLLSHWEDASALAESISTRIGSSV